MVLLVPGKSWVLHSFVGKNRQISKYNYSINDVSQRQSASICTSVCFCIERIGIIAQMDHVFCLLALYFLPFISDK